MEPSCPIRFGVFEVDVRSGELRKQGTRQRLQEQPLQILLLLLERPGEVVTRDDLRHCLWPNGTFVDFEHSLNAAIKRLRAALGDAADNPHFIETLHRRGYRFIAPVDGASGDRRRGAPGDLRDVGDAKVRIVVLPFANLSVQPGQDYFSDGLTEEMIAQLGHMHPRRLGVIARSSSMLFKRTGKTIEQVGRELNVNFVLEGGVRLENGRVRITAQLIEVNGQTQLWADSYERQYEDSLAVQAEVASRIARALAIELLPGESPVSVRFGTADTESYHIHLKGRFHWNKPGDEGVARAIEYYQKALELDPQFAQAHAALARAKVNWSVWSHKAARLVLEEARTSARRALELDPQTSEAYLALAEVHKRVDWDWPAAERCYQRALALNPSDEAAYRAYGVFLAALGRGPEAIAATERAVELDPLCLTVACNAAWVRYTSRQYDRVVAASRRTLELEPEFVPARQLLAAAYLQIGRVDESVAELRKAIGFAGDEPLLLTALAHAHAVAGRRADALAVLETLRRLAACRYVSAYQTALVYVGLGDFDASFAWFDKAAAERASGLVNLCIEPRLDPIRPDPRYVALVRRMGFPPSVQT
jgi:TolB-like protein/tetratricopeptide (TPR) repeat protein